MLQRTANHSMKRPRSPSSNRQTRPRQQMARMSSGGTPPTKQCGLEWEFNPRKETICHQAPSEENEEEEQCKICLRFTGHIHPRNGRLGSFQRATSERDHWFRESLKSSSDPSSDHDLDTEDLGSQASQHTDLERVQTELSAKCSELEQLRTQLNESENALELTRQSKLSLITENLRLKADWQKSNEEHHHLRREFSRLEDQHLATNELLRDARRELENAHQELAEMCPSTPNPIQGVRTSSTSASSRGQSQDRNGRVYIVISP